jgi:hypothetical protein
MCKAASLSNWPCWWFCLSDAWVVENKSVFGPNTKIYSQHRNELGGDQNTFCFQRGIWHDFQRAQLIEIFKNSKSRAEIWWKKLHEVRPSSIHMVHNLKKYPLVARTTVEIVHRIQCHERTQKRILQLACDEGWEELLPFES